MRLRIVDMYGTRQLNGLPSGLISMVELQHSVSCDPVPSDRAELK
jgi:hypothetical protein